VAKLFNVRIIFSYALRRYDKIIFPAAQCIHRSELANNWLELATAMNGVNGNWLHVFVKQRSGNYFSFI